MPRGSIQDETGWLNQAGHLFTLRLDSGGRWRLDLDGRLARNARKMVGKRVRLEGVRAEFDLLEVRRIEAL